MRRVLLAAIAAAESLADVRPLIESAAGLIKLSQQVQARALPDTDSCMAVR